MRKTWKKAKSPWIKDMRKNVITIKLATVITMKTKTNDKNKIKKVICPSMECQRIQI